MIEHIPTGERRYFHRIEDISTLILPYLKETDINLGQGKSISRGPIIQAPSGPKRYLKRITEVLSSTGSCVKRPRVNIAWLAHLQEWWKRRRS